MDDLVGLQVHTTEPGSSPRTDLTRDQYVTRRVRGQIDGFYLPKAEAHRKTARILRSTEFVLSLLATAITAVVGVAGKEVLGFKFDFF